MLLVTLAFLFLVAAATLAARVLIARTYPEAFSLGFLILVVLVQISSEALSAFSAFRPASVVAVWATVLMLLIAIVWTFRSRLTLPSLTTDKQSRVAYFGVGILGALTLTTGFLVAPNNWDSLTYHLSRGAHWLQEGSLDFFPLTSSRENTMSPLGDLVFAHLQVGTHDAGAAFLGQWVAGVVVLVGVGILAQTIFANPRVTALSVLVAATIPMLLSQMSTTQADLLAGVPLTVSVIAWRWVRQGRILGSVVLITLAFGVAAAIKTTSALLVLPWILIIVIQLARQRSWRALGGLAALGMATGLALNGGHAWRILTQRSGKLNAATDVLNQIITPESVIVNVIRDVTTAMLLPIPAVVRGLQALSENAIRALGFDSSLPGATFGSSYTLATAWTEDHAAAPWHILLLMLALTWLVVHRHAVPRRLVTTLLVVIVVQGLLIALAIRWQPWMNRFTFLIVVFASPLIGWLLACWPPILRGTIVALLMLAAIAWVLLQPLRGLVGTAWIPAGVPLGGNIPRYESPLPHDRFSQMFMHHPPSADTYRAALTYAEGLKPDILVMELSGDWWEFPIWVWAKSTLNDQKLTHDLGNETGRTVRICTGPCNDADLQEMQPFTSDGPSSPSVEVGPTLVVGVDR